LIMLWPFGLFSPFWYIAPKNFWQPCSTVGKLPIAGQLPTFGINIYLCGQTMNLITSSSSLEIPRLSPSPLPLSLGSHFPALNLRLAFSAKTRERWNYPLASVFWRWDSLLGKAHYQLKWRLLKTQIMCRTNQNSVIQHE
jgi:hypothetical protein